MKAERRHELQTNSLALWLRWRLPQIWQEHGTRILLGLIGVALVIIIAQRMLSAPQKAFTSAQEILSQADQTLMRIRNTDAPHEPETLKVIKADELPKLITQALNASDKPFIQARAYNLLGDYYYELAVNRISATDATTRPAGTELSDDLLKKAKDQYEKALTITIDQSDLPAHAHIGLGTIAYTRAFQSASRAEPIKWASNPLWQAALDQFDAVAADPNAPTVLKDNAIQQKGLVTLMQQNPVQMPKPGEIPIIPTTLPASTQPVEAPTTLPTTSPAIGG
jgi:hypothetical protein